MPQFCLQLAGLSPFPFSWRPCTSIARAIPGSGRPGAGTRAGTLHSATERREPRPGRGGPGPMNAAVLGAPGASWTPCSDRPTDGVARSGKPSRRNQAPRVRLSRFAPSLPPAYCRYSQYFRGFFKRRRGDSWPVVNVALARLSTGLRGGRLSPLSAHAHQLRYIRESRFTWNKGVS